MKHKYYLNFLYFLLICSSNLISQNSPPFHWAKLIGGSNSEEASAVATDAQGNVYTCGYFSGTVDFDPGPNSFTLSSLSGDDAFITKLDALGNFIWAKQIQGNSLQYANDIAIDAAGNIFICGGFDGTCDFDPGVGSFTITSNGIGSSDGYVLKLNNSGDFVWVKSLSCNTNLNIVSIKLDANDNIFLGGSFDDIADFDPSGNTYTLSPNGGLDFFILKLDNLGNYNWVNALGGSMNDNLTSIAIDASNNVYACGSFESNIDFDPSPSINSLTAVAGYDGFISKYSSTGTFIFAKQIGGLSGQSCRDILIDGANNIYACGEYGGNTDFDPSISTYTLSPIGSGDAFILKLDNLGNYSWVKSFGGSGDERCEKLSKDLSNNIYSTGYFYNTVDFDPGAGVFNLSSSGNADIFNLKLDGSGNFLWANKIGGVDSDFSKYQIVDASGIIHTVGFIDGTSDFDHTINSYSLTSNGLNDAFVHKMGPCATPSNPSNTTPLINQSICSGSSTTLSVNSFSSAIYWYPSPTSTSVIGTGSSFITSNTLTVASYTYYAEASTCTTSVNRTAISFTVNLCTTITDTENETIQSTIYPNPVANELNVQTTSSAINSKVQIMNALGSIVYSSIIDKEKIIINSTDFESGIYILQIINSNDVQTFKFIKL